MSRTLRIYNKKIKKCHRIDLTKDRENVIDNYGIVYHPYKELCMGHCPHCKDHSKDQRHLKKIKRREFRRELEWSRWNY